MRVSAREAAAMLREVGLSHNQAARVLAAGMAGSPERTSAAHLFDRDSVAHLVGWPELTEGELSTVCPDGVFLARRPSSVLGTPEEVRERWGADWTGLSPWTFLDLHLRAQHGARIAVVGTVCGFVGLGAELVAVHGVAGARKTVRLELREPGAWFEQVRQHRLLSPPGRPWRLIRPTSQQTLLRR